VSGIAITGAGVLTPGDAAAVALEHLPDAVRARAARAERITQLALAAGGIALGGARLGLGPARRERLGVVLGTAFGCLLTNAAYQQRLAAGGAAAASPRLFAATVSNAAAGELAIAFGLAGPGITLTAGVAAGTAAVDHACDLLAAGRAAAVVAGGVDARGAALDGWLAAGGLALERPVVEAAALLVLEPRPAAAARGADVLGVVLGHAIGFEPAPTAPASGAGLAAAIGRALADAGVAAAELGLVVTTAPPALGALEERGLAAVLAGAAPPRVAPKTRLGETLAAGGPLGVLAALAEAPAGVPVLVCDVCPSGHVGALVARAG
jgi:3-oxoacyl-[acyl-carrier-protein] synthase II